MAEDLYQAGFISYPRTETDSFSTTTDLHVRKGFYVTLSNLFGATILMQINRIIARKIWMTFIVCCLK